MTLAAERTATLRILTNLFGGESEKCKGSNQLALPNHFSQFILVYTITSTSKAI
jgi:hypothetical protein